MRCNQLFSISKRYLTNFTNINTYNNTLLSTEKALTILPEVYFNKEFYEIEKNLIFKNSWVPIGYTNQLDENNIVSTYYNYQK